MCSGAHTTCLHNDPVGSPRLHTTRATQQILISYSKLRSTTEQHLSTPKAVHGRNTTTHNHIHYLAYSPTCWCRLDIGYCCGHFVLQKVATTTAVLTTCLSHILCFQRQNLTHQFELCSSTKPRNTCCNTPIICLKTHVNTSCLIILSSCDNATSAAIVRKACNLTSTA